MKNINNVFQDVQQVEQKVYDIAKMQQLISQNIMQQVLHAIVVVVM